MPDYIQLLESKLSPNQKQALNAMTDVARARGITLFLTGGAVRDIISGASVRDLDITVQANPLKFKKDLEKAGFSITGEHDGSQTLYLRFAKQARLEISASRTEKFPKVARPEYQPAAILDDLHRRDFTANAMALSLNEGSWGLLLDPLNGMADIASRQLRLVSNYGFLEDPIRMVRAVRLMARTGWEMEERTRARYENAKAEGVIGSISATQRGYELEELAYEEDPLQAMKALEEHGWMEHLTPHWNSHSVDAAGLEKLRERLVQLLMAGLHPDPSAAQFRLLTAKLSPAHLSTLKKLFVRKDLVEESEGLDAEAKHLLQQIGGKDAARSSQLWKTMHSAKPEAVLWLFFTGKGATVQNRFDNFFAKWPEARQKVPNAVLQDMRITPDVEGYAELLDKLTFAFMDNELPNEEAVRKFAEPYSPPAPPPPVVVRCARAVKRVVDPKGKGKGRKSKKAAEAAPEDLTLAAADAGETPETAGTTEHAPAAKAGTKPPAKINAGKTGAAGTASQAARPEAKERPSAVTARKAPAPEKTAAASKAAGTSRPATPHAAKQIQTTHAAKSAAPSKKPEKPVAKSSASNGSGISKSAGKPAAGKAVKPVAHKPVAAKGKAKSGQKSAAVAHKTKTPSSQAAKKVAVPAKSSGKKTAKPAGKPAAKAKPAAKPKPETKKKKSAK
jgi:tRNA nucleotidyltransferase/poly(A) polymerase